MRGVIKIFPVRENIVVYPLDMKANEFVDILLKAGTDKGINLDGSIGRVSYYNHSISRVKSFIPSHTNIKSSHNFDLIGDDGEINAVTIFMEDIPNNFTEAFSIEWGTD